MRPCKAAFSALLVLAAATCASLTASAQTANWTVAKASGDVWLSNAHVQPVSLSAASLVKPGDTIRTGENGRLLLTRGDESILVSPNAVIDIPKENRDGMTTTIVERAGSILLEVEKRKVNHFEVVTPYLAAVVKGTHFRVSMDETGSHVDVLRGQVEVSDFKSGEQALILPGQTAAVSATRDRQGLSLSGSGLFNPIMQTAPRPAPVSPAPSVTRAASASPASRVADTPAESSSHGIDLEWPTALRPGRGDGSMISKDDALQIFGIPLTIGFFVTMGVAVNRGLKKRKQMRR